MKDTDELKTSVIIPTKNRQDEICRCISSLLKQSMLPDEVIIVDSGYDNCLEEILKDKFRYALDKIKYIHVRYSSITAQKNLAVEHSTGDILFFLDDDVILHEDYIKEVVEIFSKDKTKQIGGAMGNIININRTVWSPINIFKWLFFLPCFGDGRFRASGMPTFVNGKDEIVATEFLYGGTAAFKKAIFREFTFDENLGKTSGYCYNEDVDFAFRVSRNFKLVYTPTAKIYHYPSAKARETTKTEVKAKTMNHFYLFEKNILKNLNNKLAFSLSLLGMLILLTIQMKNSGIVGFFQAVQEIIHNA